MKPMVANLTTNSDPTFALALAVVVAAVYLLVLRLVDLNEKEPVWAMLLLVGLGALVAAILSVLVDSKTLHATTVGASVADVITIFITVAIGIGILEAIGRLRGWSEINDLVDGTLYGAAAGLGFATGEAFIRQLHQPSGLIDAVSSTPLDTLWPTLLAGLAFGVFGGLIGAGFGAAVDSAAAVQRVILPLVGAVVAFLVEIGYLELAHGNALSGSGAKAREWIALGLPALLFLILMVFGLRSESGAIAEELSDDPTLATSEELGLLKNHAARRAAYARRALALDAHGWLGLRSLQNRQVQYALTKRRADRASSSHRKTELGHEVERLRAAIVAAREHLAAGGAGAAAGAERPS